MQQPPPPAPGIPTLYHFLVNRSFIDIAPLPGVKRHANTRNDQYYQYVHLDPTQVGPWAGFDFPNIIAQFGHLLHQSHMKRAYEPSSPSTQYVSCEPEIRGKLDAYLWRLINNSLDVLFVDTQHALTQTLQAIRNDLTPLRPIQVVDGPMFARWVTPLLPGRTAVRYNPADRINTAFQSLRIVGDVKCSWSWDTDWRHSANRGQRREYYQVISQVYTYAQQCHARYFYVVTDKFLVCYRRRVDQNGIAILGGVEESPKIRWDTVGVPGQPGVLTAALALWYLHILASTDNPSNHPQPGGRLPSPVWSITGDRIGAHPTFLH